MKRPSRLPQVRSPRKQRGMAALLIILLTGLSLSVMTAGVMNYVSVAQDSSVSVHARTQAEINAWAGIEAWRQYLDGKVATALPDAAAIRDPSGKTIATLEKQAGCRSNEFCYKVVGRSANSTALLEVTFGSGTALPPPPVKLGSAMTLNTHFRFSGDNFTVKNPPGMGGLVVDGNINIDGISSAYSTPTCAKGSIYFGGGREFGGSYSATGDIWVTAGATSKGASLDATNIWLASWSSDFDKVRYRGFLASVDTRINKLEGIGHYFIPAEWSNITLNERSRIGGRVVLAGTSQYCTGNGAAFSCNAPAQTQPNKSLANLTDNDEGMKSPQALPAVTCNTRVVEMDLDALESQANYIFYFHPENRRPMLKIQHVVSRASRRSLDGVYDLTQETASAFPADISLPLLRCHGQSCDLGGKSATTGWGELAGLTMPPGVVYFKRNAQGSSDVSISTPAGNTLLNSFLVGGRLMLKNAGSDFALKAPNFSVSGQRDGKKQAEACSQPVEPAQLCDGNGNLKVWQSSAGTHHGLPVANAAAMVTSDFEANGWKIHGNLVVGRRIVVSGAKVSLFGTIWSGDVQARQDELQTEIGASGLEVDATGLSEDQWGMQTGGSAGGVPGSTGNAGGGTIRSPVILRSRPL